MATETPKILTLPEVAELLRVHPITVYRMIKQGRLPSFRIGRVLRFDSAQLEDWLRAREIKAATGRERKRKGAASAQYLAYGRTERFAPENLLETFAISRPLLVRSFLDANRAAKGAGSKHLVCERCRKPRNSISALVLFASERATRSWKKSVMPFCRTCFGALRRLAAPEESGRSALEAASKKDLREARPSRRTNSA